MALNYLASSWSKMRSGFKIANESSQQTLSSEPGDRESAEDPDVNTDTILNEHYPESSRDESPREMQESTLSPPLSSEITPKQKRKDRQRQRKRRPSIDTSVVPTESEEGDISSIPYRQDEEAERTSLLNDLRHSQNEPFAAGRNVSAEEDAPLTTDVRATANESIPTQEYETTGTEPLKRKPTSDRSSKPATRNRYACPKAEEFGCDKTFTMLSSARRHAESVHSDSKKQCPVCDKTFKRPDALNNHKLTHTKKELELHEEGSRSHKERAANNDGYAPAQGGSQPTEDEIVETNISDQSEHQDPVMFVARTTLEDAQQPASNGVNTNEDLEILSESEKSSSSSIFDEYPKILQEKVMETPANALKRKRDQPGSGGGKLKKPRSSAVSPPTSITTINSGFDSSMPLNAERHGHRNQDQSVRSKILSTGNLNNFAKPWVPGSDLYHPIHNPRSPLSKTNQAEIIIPQTSANGSSSRSMTKRLRSLQNSNIESSLQTPLAAKMVSAVYSSPKGKSRAEPGVEYSSPNGIASNQPALSDDEDETYQPNDFDKNGIATTVARRSLSKNASQSVDSSARKRKRSGSSNEAKRLRAKSHQTSASPADDVHLCQECHRKFQSLKALRKHEAKPNVHKQVQQCGQCGLSFGSRELLASHEKESGHGNGSGYQGRKGAFTASEVNKLIRWRNNFCDEYELTHADFNDMMTDSLRRGKGTIWPHRFISKADFLQEYYDVLPDRNRRSMHRYRERVFQNLASNQQWTKRDDDELVNLVQEIGTKWVDIGQRLGRTQDAVAQRWKNKMQYRGKLHDGEWLPNETNQLIEAVKAVKRESGFSLDPHADVKLSWESISRKLKSSRTAQQCSNKWRLMHVIRKNGKFLKGDDSSSERSASSTPLPVTTPSRMSQRLAGHTPSTSMAKPKGGNSYLSTKFVQESDEEGSSNESDEADAARNDEIDEDGETKEPNTDLDSTEPEEGSLSQDDPDVEVESESDSSDLPRNPFPATTPKNAVGLSQIFNQTQANTSALRAPRFDTHLSTQPERSSPNVPLRMRRGTSPLYPIPIDSQDAINQEQGRTVEESSESGIDSRLKREDSTRSPARKLPEVATVAAAVDSPSTQDSSSDTSSEESSNSDEDSEDEDEMVQDTKKESFMQSLVSPDQRNGDAISKLAPPKAKDWHSVIRGGAAESEESSEDE